ncbi:MAG: hypothetical protein ABJG40_09125, partial [Polaribacter sp.]
YTTILFFIVYFFIKNIEAQEIELKITSKIKDEQLILNNIKFKNSSKDTVFLKKEIDRISNYLKSLGYLSNTYITKWKSKNELTTYYTLNTKIEKAIIKVDFNTENNFKLLKVEKGLIHIPFHKLKKTLTYIYKELESQGRSFSKVQLKNINIYNKTLFADLNINQSKKRTIDKVTIKGYKNFPQSFIKNYFNLKSNTVFKQKLIQNISKSTKNILFVSEIKPPEILFTKDSTILYMYLNKVNRNSFDGNINFASKENGKLLFNGNINLTLNNILNKGEKIKLNINSIEQGKQDFSLLSEIPYVFNSKISPEFKFLIHKEDSTFLNTKFESKISYQLNQKANIAFTYNSESSKNISKLINQNIETFQNYFTGLKFQYKIKKNDYFQNNKLNLEINPSIGNRNTDTKNQTQLKIESSISYLWNLNLKNSFFIRNNSGILISDTLLNNELYRIGGATTIRGYNEQSLFTDKYSYFNIEYRYLTSLKSYFYTITDIANINIDSINKNLLGLGFGYHFTSNNSQINLSTVISKNNKQKLNTKNTKLLISWRNYF